jgi:hypothetical protein
MLSTKTRVHDLHGWTGHIKLQYMIFLHYIAYCLGMVPCVSFVSLHWCMSYFSKTADAYTWNKIMDMLLAYDTADGSDRMSQYLYHCFTH